VDFSLKLTNHADAFAGKTVSILVLVDFSLKLAVLTISRFRWAGFNPCFGGFFSKTIGKF